MSTLMSSVLQTFFNKLLSYFKGTMKQWENVEFLHKSSCYCQSVLHTFFRTPFSLLIKSRTTTQEKLWSRLFLFFQAPQARKMHKANLIFHQVLAQIKKFHLVSFAVAILNKFIFRSLCVWFNLIPRFFSAVQTTVPICDLKPYRELR